MSNTSIQQQVIPHDVSPSLKAYPERASRWRLDLVGWGFILPLLIAYTIFLLWPGDQAKSTVQPPEVNLNVQ